MPCVPKATIMADRDDDPRRRNLIEWLDAYERGLWNNMLLVAELPEQDSASIVCRLLALACEAQHVGNIELGREGILSLPRNWLLERIESIADVQLDLDQEWEYRRLLEVYEKLDKQLLLRLIERGRASSDESLREAANDFRASAT